MKPETTATKERARRRFMQIHGRYLEWGLVGPARSAGVEFVDDAGLGAYRRFTCHEYYIDHGWAGGDLIPEEVIDATEVAVIDKAMETLTKRDVQGAGSTSEATPNGQTL